MSVVGMNYLLEAGVHFGHQKRRWNPKMREYIFTSRDDIYIIDLQKTVKKIQEAYSLINKIAADGGKVLFVGTKKQAQEATKEEAIRSNMYYVCERWLGGTLTNFKTIRNRVTRLEEIEKMEKDGTFALLPKKEVLKLKKEYDKLDKYLCGIREMRKLPQAMIIVDSKKEYNAIMEARKLKIPVVGIIDTNCDPDLVDYVIPGNDDAVRAVKVVLGVLANAIVEANGGMMIDYIGDVKEQPQVREIKKVVKQPIVKPEIKEQPQVREIKKVVKQPIVKPEIKEQKVEPVKTEPKLEPVKAEKPAVSKEEKKEPVKKEKPTVSKESKKEESLTDLTVTELRERAKTKGIKGYSKLKKEELINALK